MKDLSKKFIKICLFLIIAQIVVYLFLAYLILDDSGGIPSAARKNLKKAQDILLRRQLKSEKNGQICIQVITPARNSQTGEVRDFPTPCDVPEGWEKL